MIGQGKTELVATKMVFRKANIHELRERVQSLGVPTAGPAFAKTPGGPWANKGELVSKSGAWNFLRETPVCLKPPLRKWQMSCLRFNQSPHPRIKPLAFQVAWLAQHLGGLLSQFSHLADLNREDPWRDLVFKKCP